MDRGVVGDGTLAGGAGRFPFPLVASGVSRITSIPEPLIAGGPRIKFEPTHVSCYGWIGGVVGDGTMAGGAGRFPFPLVASGVSRITINRPKASFKMQALVWNRLPCFELSGRRIGSRPGLRLFIEERLQSRSFH